MPDHPHRRKNSLRLDGYDYSQSGGYYVTMCTHQKAKIFGAVADGEVQLSAYGEIVRACWLDLPEHYYHLRLDMFVIMPNHIHAIMLLLDDNIASENKNTGNIHIVGADPTTDLPRPRKRHTISEMIRAFKSYSTMGIKQAENYADDTVWQRGFYDHIIRNDDDLRRIQQYIVENPLKWESDDYY